MKKLRLLPILLTLFISSAVLFGGYFAYRSLAMENPMQEVVADVEGAELVSLKLNNTTAVLELKLSKDSSIREVYQQIATDGSEILGNRLLEIRTIEEDSKELEKWWSSALFEVAQAMETRQYAQIPKALEVLAKEGMTVTTEMDEANVYVTMKDNNAIKRVVLPRTPMQWGVWTTS